MAAIEALKVQVSEAEGRMDRLRVDMGKLKEVGDSEDMSSYLIAHV